MNALDRRITSHLTKLNRKLDKVVEFRRPDDEESTGSKVAKTAGAVAGAGALYAGGSYLRGRLGMKEGDWNYQRGKPGMAGIWANMKAGHRQNVSDFKSAADTAKTAVGGARDALVAKANSVAPGTMANIDKARSAVVGAGQSAAGKLSSAASAVGAKVAPVTAAVSGFGKTVGSKASGFGQTVLAKSKLMRGRIPKFGR